MPVLVRGLHTISDCILQLVEYPEKKDTVLLQMIMVVETSYFDSNIKVCQQTFSASNKNGDIQSYLNGDLFYNKLLSICS